jgi:hypothetical protein
MSRWRTIGMAVLFASAAACNRGKTDDAIAKTATATPAGENAQTTLTGCLGPGSRPGSYVLTVARAEDSNGKPQGTSGTAGAPPETDASPTQPTTTIYEVVARNADDATANLGARVSVIGVVDNTAPIAPAAGANDAGTPVPGAARTVRATTITKIGDACQ